MLRIMMLLAKARNDVMFAHYAVRRNIIHAVNITAEGNITCPQGQTSFSVNAPLRASRYLLHTFLSFYMFSLAKYFQMLRGCILCVFARTDWIFAWWLFTIPPPRQSRATSLYIREAVLGRSEICAFLRLLGRSEICAF